MYRVHTKLAMTVPRVSRAPIYWLEPERAEGNRGLSGWKALTYGDPRAFARGAAGRVGEELHAPAVVETRVFGRPAGDPVAQRREDVFRKAIAEARVGAGVEKFRLG